MFDFFFLFPPMLVTRDAQIHRAVSD